VENYKISTKQPTINAEHMKTKESSKRPSNSQPIRFIPSMLWVIPCLFALTGCSFGYEKEVLDPTVAPVLPATSTNEPSPTFLPKTATPAPTNTPYPSSSPQDPTITVCGSGCDYQTVQSAINNSKTADGAVIRIMDEVHTEAGIVVTKSIAIQGLSLDRSIIQAHEDYHSATDRVFLVQEGAQVIIRDLIIQKGYPAETPYTGGGILNFGELIVENCLIQKNQAGDAGGIQNRGILTIINTTISHNFADGIGDPGMECGKGGGIVNAFQSTLTIHNSQITNNVAAGKGGGLHVACEGRATLTNTVISENKSTRNGGGVFLKGTLTLIDSQITRNSTPADGGGVIIYGVLNYIDSAIKDNLTGGNCIIWGDESYRGKGEVGITDNTRIPDNNCHFQ
jgi:hypothetical protein